MELERGQHGAGEGAGLRHLGEEIPLVDEGSDKGQEESRLIPT